MAKLTKQEALAKLERAIERLDYVKAQPTFSPEFTKWKRDTQVAIRYVFGESSGHMQEFATISYVERDATDDNGNLGAMIWKDTVFKRGLDKAQAVLQSMVDEVTEYWQDDVVTLAHRNVTPVQSPAAKAGKRVGFQADAYRVLIASPSDVAAERQAIPEVISAWNAVHAADLGVVLLPVMWETHSSPEMGDRPQAIINRQLVADCDMLVGTFWTRIGSHTGVAESGTIEEINQFRAAGKPVLLYFSSAPVSLDDVDLEQYQRLKAYRQTARNEGLVEQYASVGELREKLSRQLLQAVRSIQRKAGDTVETRTDTTADSRQSLAMVQEQFRLLVRRFEAEWVAERDSEPIKLDAAKSLLQRLGNHLLDSRPQLDGRVQDQAVATLDALVKETRLLQRHRVFVDGGVSHRTFWQTGDEIFRRLAALLDTLGAVPTDLPPLTVTLGSGRGADYGAADPLTAQMGVLAVSIVNDGPRPITLAATDPVRAVMEDGDSYPLPDTQRTIDGLYGPLATYSKRPPSMTLGESEGVTVLLPRGPWRVLRSGKPAHRWVAIEVIDNAGRTRGGATLPAALAHWFYDEPIDPPAANAPLVAQTTGTAPDLAIALGMGAGEDFLPKTAPESAFEMLVIHVRNQGQASLTLTTPDPLRLVLEDGSEIRVPDDPSRDRERVKLAYCRGCPDDGRLAPGDELAVVVPRQYWGTLRLDGEVRCVAVRAIDVAGKTKAQVELPQELAHWFNDELVDQQKAIWEQQSQQ